jgi:very-short-patch-repair endonuclease
MTPDDRLHVAVPQNAARLRSPTAPRARLDPSPSVVVHWNHFEWAPPANACEDSVAASIAHLILCQPRTSAIATIDSALNSRLISRNQLREILSHLPASHAVIDTLADGRAQSGLETFARLRLGSKRIRVRIQVDVPGVGRVDTLIGDRLILELDSRSHHLGDNYEKDRTRDLHAIESGYVVLRVSYHRVMHDWASIERVVLALVRRGDHEWRTSHRRLGLAPALHASNSGSQPR